MAPKVGVKRCLQNFQTRSVSYDSKQGKGHSWSGNKPEKVQIWKPKEAMGAIFWCLNSPLQRARVLLLTRPESTRARVEVVSGARHLSVLPRPWQEEVTRMPCCAAASHSWMTEPHIRHGAQNLCLTKRKQRWERKLWAVSSEPPRRPEITRITCTAAGKKHRGRVWH